MGTMGGPMARRLASSCYAVRGFDVSAERSKQAAAAGVTLATSPAEAAQDADVVMSSLPDPATVRRAYLGPDGVLPTIRNGATLIDLRTIDPETWLWLGPSVAAAQERRYEWEWGMHPMWGMWGVWGIGMMLLMQPSISSDNATRAARSTRKSSRRRGGTSRE